jgi:Uri superfamily endonuclease
MPIPRGTPGTYVLVMRSVASAPIEIGRLGGLQLRPGTYIYIGSALGQGGVAARVAHHLRRSRHPHWHIDYLRASVEGINVYFCLGSQHLEHEWAQRIAALRGASIPLRRFGASDCDCESHLYCFRTEPSPRTLPEVLQTGGFAASRFVPDAPVSARLTLSGRHQRRSRML